MYIFQRVQLVLHQHGIAPTFLKFDLWLPGAGFNPIISTKRNKNKERKILRKKLSVMHTKRILHFLKMGAIPCLPFQRYISCKKDA